MAKIKIITEEKRIIICPVCKKKIDTLTGNHCTHLEKIIIRKNKDHVAIFNN